MPTLGSRISSWRGRGAGRDSPPRSSHRVEDPRRRDRTEPGPTEPLRPPVTGLWPGSHQGLTAVSTWPHHPRPRDYTPQSSPRPCGGAGHPGTCSPFAGSAPPRAAAASAPAHYISRRASRRARGPPAETFARRVSPRWRRGEGGARAPAAPTAAAAGTGEGRPGWSEGRRGPRGCTTRGGPATPRQGRGRREGSVAGRGGRGTRPRRGEEGLEALGGAAPGEGQCGPRRVWGSAARGGMPCWGPGTGGPAPGGSFRPRLFLKAGRERRVLQGDLLLPGPRRAGSSVPRSGLCQGGGAAGTGRKYPRSGGGS